MGTFLNLKVYYGIYAIKNHGGHNQKQEVASSLPLYFFSLPFSHFLYSPSTLNPKP